MKRFLMSSVACAVLAMGAPLAMAQQDQHGPDQMQHQTVQHDTMQHQSTQHEAPQHESMQHGNVSHPPMENHGAPAHEAMGGHRGWHNGEHYTGPRNHVAWRAHHLRQPPHGYEWVRNGSDYVLIAIGSGIIAEVIASH